MAALVACPKCKTKLKINKLPAESQKIQCPQCQTYFMVAAPKATGATARTPAPANKAAPRKTQPDRPAPASEPRSGKKKWIGLVALLLLICGGLGAYLYTQGQPDQPKPGPTNTPIAARKEKDNEEPPTKIDIPKEKKDQDKKDKKEKKEGGDKKFLEYTKLMDKAGQDAKSGRYQAALAEYDNVLKQFPDDKDAKKAKEELIAALAAQLKGLQGDDKSRNDLNELVKQGNEALGKRQYPAALEFFKLAIQKSPGDADAKSGLTAVTEAMSRDAEQQKKQADQLAMEQKKLEDYNAYIAAAQAALQAKSFADAYQKAVSAQNVFPSNADAVGKALELRKAAEEGLTGLQNQDERKKQFTQLMAQGGAALQNKRADEALQVYKQALALFPDDPTAAKGLGDAQALDKQFKAQFQTWMAQGNQALIDGRFPDAINAFREASRLYPDDAMAIAALNNAEQAFNRVTLYNQAMQRGAVSMLIPNFPAAISAFSDALAVVPNDQAATLALANAQQAFAVYLIAKQQVDAKVAQAILLLQQQMNAPASQLLNDSVKQLPIHPNIGYIQQLALYASGMVRGQAANNDKRLADAVPAFTDAVNGVAPLAVPPINDPLAQLLTLNAQKFLDDAKQTLTAATQDFDAKFLQASTFLKVPNYPSASKWFNDANAAFPLHPRAKEALVWKAYADAMGRGEVAMKTKNYPNAVLAYTDALKAVPSNPPATQALASAQQLALGNNTTQKDFDFRVKQGNLLITQRKYVDALKLFNEAIKLLPTDPQIPAIQTQANYADAMSRGVLASEGKDYATAVASYKNALTAIPKDPVAQQELQNAQKLLQDITLARKDFDGKVQQANALLKQQKFAEASKMFTSAINSSPQDPQVPDLQKMARYADSMGKGYAALSAKGYSDAVAAFTDALTNVPKDAAAQQGLSEAQKSLTGVGQAKEFDAKVLQGNALLAQKNYFDAAAAFNAAVKAMPKNPMAPAIQTQANYAAAMARGQSAMTAKNYTLAQTGYNDALKVIPNDPAATQGLQDARQVIQGAGQAKEFDSAVKVGNILLKQHRYAEAAKQFNDAVKLMPAHPQAGAVQKQGQYADAMGNGESALKIKNYPNAVSAYGDALKVLPGDVAAQQGLNEAQNAIKGAGNAKDYAVKVQQAHAFMKQQKYAEAGQLYSEAVKLMPNSKQGRYADAMVKGIASWNAKNYRDAVNHFQAALTEITNDPAATAALNHARKLAK